MTAPRRHWRSYGAEPLPTPAEALAEPFAVFPSCYAARGGCRAGMRLIVDRGGIDLLFTTGYALHNGVLDHGVHFIAKPFILDALVAKVREVRAAPGSVARMKVEG